jgi:hypothetical protein
MKKHLLTSLTLIGLVAAMYGFSKLGITTYIVTILLLVFLYISIYVNLFNKK